MAGNLGNEFKNLPRSDVVPKFSDWGVITLCFTSEAIGIDSESYFFVKLGEYKNEFSNLISLRQCNDRRKFTTSLCNMIRKKTAESIDGSEDSFCISS